MTAIGAARLTGEITASTQALATLIDGADLNRPVPTCPEWTLRELAAHVGRVHRWAAQLVSTGAAQRLPFGGVPDRKLPADPAQQPRWLRAGAERVLAALAEAGTRQVWTHLGPGPASYWLRRMAHETAVHRADAAIARGDWPARAYACTAVDAETGEFVTWSKDSGVPIERAIASSCCVPGIFPPITINGRHWGGIRIGCDSSVLLEA